jgi:hypothetical protein
MYACTFSICSQRHSLPRPVLSRRARCVRSCATTSVTRPPGRQLRQQPLLARPEEQRHHRLREREEEREKGLLDIREPRLALAPVLRDSDERLGPLANVSYEPLARRGGICVAQDPKYPRTQLGCVPRPACLISRPSGNRCIGRPAMLNALRVLSAKKLGIFALIAWFMISVVYIGYDRWRHSLAEEVARAVEQSRREIVAQILGEAAKCRPFNVANGDQSAQLVAVSCLQQNAAGAAAGR